MKLTENQTGQSLGGNEIMTADDELYAARCDLKDLLDELGILFDPEEETEILIQRVADEAKRLKKTARKVRP